MSSVLKRIFKLERYSEYEWRKLTLLTMSFFLIIGAYTLVRELKSSMFMTIVGKEYVPWARMIVMVGLVPAVLFYSYLVNRLRRYQLLYFYCFLYGIVGIICTYFIAHPVIGISNTDSSPSRLFGWFFYFFIEGFSPFVISVFWAFANSIFSPDEAKENYAIMVTGSKIGGMITAGLAWYIFSCQAQAGMRMFSDVVGHQIILFIFSILVLAVAYVVYRLIKDVPGRYLHGYEAVYKVEKKKKEEEKPGILSGLILLIKIPYILGIFGMVFFYEITSSVLSYHRLGVAQASSTDISGVSCFLFQVAFIQHFVGIIISFLGTRTLLHIFGVRVCLMLIPVVTGFLLLFFTMSVDTDYAKLAIVIGLILLQAVNYAFAQPVRESLYIPTVKDVKFKSKSWIDAFGSRFAKGVGSTFNIISDKFGPAFFFTIHSTFFAIITVVWGLTAYIMGLYYARAVEHNEVIGLETDEEEQGLTPGISSRNN